MDVAPVEYMVISFPGNRFNGDIAPAIADLVDRGVVHIIDLVFVKKDAEGNVSAFEFDETEDGSPFASVDGDADGVISEDDIEAIAAQLEPNSSALYVLWEDLWAAELGRAIRAAGGELLIGERVGRAALEAALVAAGADGPGGRER